MKASSRNSSLSSSGLLQRFLQTPSLDFSSEGFPYKSFDTTSHLSTVTPASIPHELMIGKQAEHCFEYYLQTSTRYHLLANNIQIQGASATKGELDYIVYDREEEQYVHIELACKFYLFDNSREGYAQWTGPNRKDSLDQKLDKLSQKQFPLLFSAEASTMLEHLNLKHVVIAQRLCLKSFLFIPKEIHPEDISERWSPSIVGQWMDLTHFQLEDPNAAYLLPKKTEWLLPPDSLSNWISLKAILPLIQEHHEHKKTPLVYQKSNRVLKLFFIVWWK